MIGLIAQATDDGRHSKVIRPGGRPSEFRNGQSHMTARTNRVTRHWRASEDRWQLQVPLHGPKVQQFGDFRGTPFRHWTIWTGQPRSNEDHQFRNFPLHRDLVPAAKVGANSPPENASWNRKSPCRRSRRFESLMMDFIGEGGRLHRPPLLSTLLVVLFKFTPSRL